jgi:predicted nucleic acid-binding protein
VAEIDPAVTFTIEKTPWGTGKIHVELVQRLSWAQSLVGVTFKGARYTLTAWEAGELASAMWRAIRIAKGETRVASLDEALHDLQNLEGVVLDTDPPASETVYERVRRLKKLAKRGESDEQA